MTEANLPSHGHVGEFAIDPKPLPTGVRMLTGGLLSPGMLRRACGVGNPKNHR